MTFKLNADLPVDTINLVLSAEDTVQNETVKITVSVNAIITNDQTEDGLRKEIDAALKSFISAEWALSGLTRGVDQSGYERLVLQASTRVNERENYDLASRIKAVSRKGLQLTNIQTDASIPRAQLEEAERGLRMAILKKATEEVNAIKETIGDTYTIYTVAYDVDSPYNRKAAGMLMASTAAVHESVGSVGGPSLANTQKLSLSAQITLRLVDYRVVNTQ